MIGKIYVHSVCGSAHIKQYSVSCQTFSRIAYQMFPKTLNLHMKEFYVTSSENLDEQWTQVLWNKT